MKSRAFAFLVGAQQEILLKVRAYMYKIGN